MKHLSIVIIFLSSQAIIKFTEGISDKQWFVSEENSLFELKGLRTEISDRNGPKILPNPEFLEKIGHFVRGRTLSRAAFPHGTGAFGYFVCKHDSLNRFTKANLFTEIGKRIKVSVRFGFSLVGVGSPETSQASLGYSMTIRFHTEEGNLDIVSSTNPGIIRDPIRILDAGHSQTLDVNAHPNLNRKWNMATLVPEILHTTIYDKADLAFPRSLRMIIMKTPQTLKLVDGRGGQKFVRFSLEPLIETRYLKDETALELAGRIPDYYSRELFSAIKRGNYPKWELRAQIISPDKINGLDFNPLDPSRIWDENIIPLIPIGEIILNENPSNFFTQVEQLAFNPTNVISGIEVTFGDKFLQGRGQVYLDAQRHRLGPNFAEFQMNKPFFKNIPYVLDGYCADPKKGKSDPNYYPNSFGPTRDSLRDHFSPGQIKSSAILRRYNTVGDDNYSQLNKTWISWSKSEQNRVVTRLWKEFSALERFIRDAALKQIKLINIEFYEKFLPLLEQTSGW